MAVCYIVGAGDFAPFVKQPDDFVIAADGGLDHLISAGIAPDLLVGDLDSLEGDIPKGVELIRFPVKKDYTDTHLCYLEGVRRGYSDFVITGATGGRPDHTYANYSLLLRIFKDKNEAVMIDEKYGYTVVYNGRVSMRKLGALPGRYISVFALGEVASDVCISGLEYEVAGVELASDFPLGVSNRVVSSDGEISVGCGALLLMWER